MFFILIFILLTVGFTFLYNLIPTPSLWFIILWIFAAILTTILVIIVWALLFIKLCPRNKPNGKIRHFVLRDLVWLFVKLYHVKYEVVGRENIPDETFVVYANHKSNMDPLILYLALKKRLTAVGKSTLFKHPVMNNIKETFGAISIDRDNDREALKQIIFAIKEIKEGLSMIIFPEGGIKDRNEEEMVSLRAGAYKLVTKSQATILPISIIGSSEISKRKRYKRKNVKVIIHEPIRYDAFKQMNTNEIGLMVEEIINNGVKNG